MEIWKFNRRVASAAAGATLRVVAGAPFRLRWTRDEWRTVSDDYARGAAGMCYADVKIPKTQRAPLRFTFFWTQDGRWEGEDFEVEAGR